MNATQKFALAAFLLVPTLASTASADTIFDLRDPAIENIDEAAPSPLPPTESASLSPPSQVEWPTPTPSSTKPAAGFGVNAAGVLDSTFQIDDFGNMVTEIESVSMVFNRDVYFKQLALSLYSLPTRVPPGDLPSRPHARWLHLPPPSRRRHVQFLQQQLHLRRSAHHARLGQRQRLQLR